MSSAALLSFSSLFLPGFLLLPMVGFPIESAATAQDSSTRQKETDRKSEDELDTKLQVESFDKVWQTVKDQHWDKDLGGVDWEKARKELRPKVAEAKNIEEVRRVLSELLNRLGKSHFAIIPAAAYKATELQRSGEADSGLTFRLSGDRVLVTQVRAECDAQKKGVRPGWQVVQVGDRDVAEFVAKIREAKGLIRPETMIGFRFANLLTGKANETIQCRFLDLEDRERDLEIGLSIPPGKWVKFGNLPRMRIDMESRRLDSNVGYFRFSGFFDPIRLMPAYRKSVNEFRDAAGLVIDIRGNGGGMIGMTMGMAGPLSATGAPLGVMKMRNQELRAAVFKSNRPYDRPVAILVDETSASASEIFAGGLQDLKIARIFGNRTAGLSLPSTIEKLPNGDGFQFAFANYQSAAGAELEGAGVTPDVVVPLNRDNLGREIDPVLKKAIQWIHSQNE